ncbi:MULTISPECIES: hypothetical protein [unclassified Nocardioides]|uniref:hypothetical protein n=1 Tax=unclassified Nocardioides TaxID=2615069 RepID=UPI0009F158DB|nr:MULTISPECIES: hypothetical protein [unclassified Nocardioides]GAW49849.1 Serine/arginine repetitive matrix protein 2 [Nocardioides sp. PD653-B2]GAW54605.1 Serine/arginine repetitive matrix protein 2 [Nocardioides sp. PD653]
MTDDSAEDPPRLEIDWLRVVAGALAAVASAVLLSTLGAAGTIIGAALGSVVVTVSSAYLSQGLATSRRTLAKAQAAARDKVGIAQAEVRRAGRADDTRVQDSHLEHADERLAEAHEELDAMAEETAPAPWRQRLVALPWKRVALAAAALFVIAILAITAFELIAGRSVSSITGGSSKNERSTLGDVGGGSGKDDQQKQPDDQSSPSPSPSESPEPTETPTETPSETPTPSETTTPSPTESATPSETAGPTPTEPSPS